MGSNMERIAAILALLCYVGCGCGIILYSLRRKELSRASIIIALVLGGVGLCGSLGFWGESGTPQIGGYIWTVIWIAKGTIEFVRYRKKDD